MQGTVYVTYQDAKSETYALRIEERLIRAGTPEVYLSSYSEVSMPVRAFADVVVAIIGKEWKPTERWRDLEEVANTGIPVILVLLEYAVMPAPVELPGGLKLWRRETFRISEASFEEDVDALIKQIISALALPAGGTPDWRPKLTIDEMIAAIGGIRRMWPSASGDARGGQHKSSDADASRAPATLTTEVADVLAFAPTSAAPGVTFLVQIFVGRTRQDEAFATRQALASDPTTQKRVIATLDVELAHGDRLDIRLEAPGLTIAEPTESLVWRGQPCSCSFPVTVPLDFSGGQVILQARVFRQAVPIGKVAFALPIKAGAKPEAAAPAGDFSRMFRSAFLSYAEEDLAEVVKRAQVLRAAKIELFQDVLCLEPGERWERRLYLEIDKCDLFFLFWSSAARNSVWVGKEIQYALDRIKTQTPPESARPEIEIIILEGPPFPEPPDSLADRHFKDKFLYFIAALDKLNAARPAN